MKQYNGWHLLPFFSEVMGSLLHVWLNCVVVMVVQFIIFMVKYLWLVNLLHLWLKVITFMVNLYYNITLNV